MTITQGAATLAAMFAVIVGMLAPSSTTVSGSQPGPQPEQSASTSAARSPRNANYDIDVQLDHDRRTLRGRQTVRWRNISANPTSELRLHLYWNAWRDAESTWMRGRRDAGFTAPVPDDSWSSIDVTTLRIVTPDGDASDLSNALRHIAPDDGNGRDRTLAIVPLPRPLGSGETLQIEVSWNAKIPGLFRRTGYAADDYVIAHWFPKIGVLEDEGWNAHQFHYSTEFYADFGVYEVDITVPERFVVGATGREEERADNGDGTVTHRYRAEDVHDFAWAASPSFIDLRERISAPSPAGTDGAHQVDVRLLLRPEHRTQAPRFFEATRATLTWLGERVGPYAYDRLTIVDPPYQAGSGGMEYPMLFTAGTRWLAPDAVPTPESVTIHEAAHQWWQTVVATNEVEHAWMDEGLTAYTTSRVLDAIDHPRRLALRFLGGFFPLTVRDISLTTLDHNGLANYRFAAETDIPSTPSFKYAPATAPAITYDKTALWLQTLERYLGASVLERILRTYYERWQFRHPAPEDFFAIANEVSGQDLTWFFDQVYRSSNVFDYAVQRVSTEALSDGTYHTTVVVRRLGEAVFPVDVVTTFESGEQMTERWDGRDRRVTYSYERASRAANAQVDPQRLLVLDVDYTNNSRTREPRAAEAGRKWAATWMVWLQDLMLTYAFFV